METTSQHDDNQPATKGDLRQLEARLERRFDGRIGKLEVRMDALENHMSILHEDLREIRKMLGNALLGGMGILGALLAAAVGTILL